MRRGVLVAAAVAAAVAGWLWLWPASLGGQTAYVVTQGTSMEPEFHTGDLALIRPAESYAVGDVAAYRSSLLHTVVMHRIVAVQDGRYTFKGDSNAWLDPEHPAAADLVGELAVHVPQGGAWLDRLGSPVAVALGLFVVLATGGTVARTRNRRKRQQRRASMSRHTATRPLPPPAGLPRAAQSRTAQSGAARAMGALAAQSRAITASALVLGAFGLGLGSWSWGGPLDQAPAAPGPGPARMAFSYTATVPATPAYDDTTVSAPDPVFRKLANRLEVHYAYQGSPGTVSVTADLSTASGWHASLPLSAPASFTGSAYEGSVQLDLQALDGRAQAAAAATGVPAGTVAVAVTVHVVDLDGTAFQPALRFNLTPLQLSLAGEAKDLVVVDTGAARAGAAVLRTLGVEGWNITAAAARMLSAVLLAVAMLGFAVARAARARGGDDEAAAFRRRHSSMLVAVRPITTAPGRPVIDVASFADLARLAERYGLLVLHWTRSGIETFVVQDEGTTYRYRIGAQDPRPEGSGTQQQPATLDSALEWEER
ncbi:MAG TPA: signal peptidase I [Sinomonas sp.]|nr:signal peptidase I [Sinomonas sp.]